MVTPATSAPNLFGLLDPLLRIAAWIREAPIPQLPKICRKKPVPEEISPTQISDWTVKVDPPVERNNEHVSGPNGCQCSSPALEGITAKFCEWAHRGPADIATSKLAAPATLFMTGVEVVCRGEFLAEEECFLLDERYRDRRKTPRQESADPLIEFSPVHAPSGRAPSEVLLRVYVSPFLSFWRVKKPSVILAISIKVKERDTETRISMEVNFDESQNIRQKTLAKISFFLQSLYKIPPPRGAPNETGSWRQHKHKLGPPAISGTLLRRQPAGIPPALGDCVESSWIALVVIGRLMPMLAEYALGDPVDTWESCRVIVETLTRPPKAASRTVAFERAAKKEEKKAKKEPGKELNKRTGGAPNIEPLLTRKKSNRQSRFYTEYEIVTVLGSGGFGRVYLCRHLPERTLGRGQGRPNDALSARRLVAVKAIRIVASRRYRWRKSLKEANLAAEISHPSVVRYYGAWIECIPKQGCDDGSHNISEIMDEDTQFESDDDEIDGDEERDAVLYLTMEYVSGTTLYDAIRLCRLYSKPNLCWRLLEEIVKGLAFLHEKKLIHRDLKPANIFLCAETSPVAPSQEEPVHVVHSKACSAAAGDTCQRPSSLPRGLRWNESESEMSVLGKSPGSVPGKYPDSSDSGSDEGRRPLPNNSLLRSLLFRSADNRFEDIKIKIGDFGLATVVDAGTEDVDTRRGNRRGRRGCLSGGLGTPFYIAPEQEKGGVYDSKVDMFSLGITLFEMFYPPFKNNDERTKVLHDLSAYCRVPHRFMKSAPAGVVPILRALIHHDPRQRPSAAEILNSPLLPSFYDHRKFGGILELLKHTRMSPIKMGVLERLFENYYDARDEIQLEASLMTTPYPCVDAFYCNVSQLSSRLAKIFRLQNAVERRPSIVFPIGCLPTMTESVVPQWLMAAKAYDHHVASLLSEWFDSMPPLVAPLSLSRAVSVTGRPLCFLGSVLIQFAFDIYRLRRPPRLTKVYSVVSAYSGHGSPEPCVPLATIRAGFAASLNMSLVQYEHLGYWSSSDEGHLPDIQVRRFLLESMEELSLTLAESAHSAVDLLQGYPESFPSPTVVVMFPLLLHTFLLSALHIEESLLQMAIYFVVSGNMKEATLRQMISIHKSGKAKSVQIPEESIALAVNFLGFSGTLRVFIDFARPMFSPPNFAIGNRDLQVISRCLDALQLFESILDSSTNVLFTFRFEYDPREFTEHVPIFAVLGDSKLSTPIVASISSLQDVNSPVFAVGGMPFSPIHGSVEDLSDVSHNVFATVGVELQLSKLARHLLSKRTPEHPHELNPHQMVAVVHDPQEQSSAAAAFALKLNLYRRGVQCQRFTKNQLKQYLHYCQQSAHIRTKEQKVCPWWLVDVREDSRQQTGGATERLTFTITEPSAVKRVGELFHSHTEVLEYLCERIER